MKKILVLLLALSLIFTLVACGEDTAADPTAQPTKAPTAAPTKAPTPVPTEAPTPDPNATPEPELVAIDNLTVLAFDFEESAATAAVKAVDGDETTRWSAYAASKYTMTDYDHYLIIDLGAVYTVAEISLYFEYVVANCAVAIANEYGEGIETEWTTIMDLYEQDEWIGPGSQIYEITDVEPVAGRYLKVYSYLHDDMEVPSGHPYFSIYELSLYGYAAQ